MTFRDIDDDVIGWLRRDSRVALSLLGDKNNAQALREYLVVYCDARAIEGGAVRLGQGLTPFYLGPSADFPPLAMRNLPGLHHAYHSRAFLRNRYVGFAVVWVNRCAEANDQI